jgi:hypothetical protein
MKTISLLKKAIITSIAIGVLSGSALYAKAAFDLGLNLGGWIPHDKKVSETFGRDFAFNGHIGLYDNASGWELRGNLGHYTSISHNPLDIGNEFRLSVTPLTGSLIYNAAGKNAFIQPFIGAGAGAYFYNLNDEIFNTLESGTKFGFHALGGIRFYVHNKMYFNVEYKYHFIPKIFFSKSENFNSSDITFGTGFLLSIGGEPEEEYISKDDPILTQIELLTSEIQAMKNKRLEMETAVDNFYTKSDYLISTDLLSSLDNGANLLNGILMIIDPNTQKILIKGEITSVATSGLQTKLILTKKRWKTTVIVKRDPLLISIENETINGITEQNARNNLLLSNISNSQTFALELRKAKYYERKIKHIDKRINKAQAELKTLNKQWQGSQVKITNIQNTQPAESSTTIIRNNYINRNRPYRPHRSNRYSSPRNNYRYYSPKNYAPPVYKAKPAKPTVKEKEAYIEKKQKHIRSLKNR